MHSPLKRLTATLTICAAVLAGGCSRTDQPSEDGVAAGGPYDLWIRNGTIIDGTGRERYTADVLVRADTIAFIGKLDGEEVHAARTIDATGKVVVPGFIDAHAHGDPTISPMATFLAQGITTVVLGQDGVTAAFAGHDTPSLEEWRAASEANGDKVVTLEQWMRLVDERGSEVNVAALSGHGSLRRIAGVGTAPEPTAEQLAAMQEILSADLAAGAFGLSFGLEYSPGRYSSVEEQKALGDLVGKHGGLVMSHMRSEDFDEIASAIDELLAIDARLHVSHIKIVAGDRVEQARAVLDQLAKARAAGKIVTADVYPYLASAADLVFLYPDWAKRPEQYQEAVRNRRAELEAHIRSRVAERLGPEAILFTGGPHSGKRLSDLARQLGKPFEKVIIDDLGYGGPESAHFVMTPQVHDELVRAPFICISTDGSPRLKHPRSAGSFVKVLEDHVGEPPRMTMEQAIHKMSGLAAQILGLKDRGVLASGMKADLLVIDPARLRNRATWTEPLLPPEGLDVVIVNGALALEAGEPRGRHGRMLRATEHPS
jgi:N-acyl-D-aspartate/D-glutamate deacylase